MQKVSITDVSTLQRYGVKGPQAATWLASHGVVIPTDPNTWVLSDNAIVMRLGSSEFLIEDQIDGKACAKLEADQLRTSGVYKVPRADAAYTLAGSDVRKLLSEICALDLREHALAENAVVMTQIAGISATLLRLNLNNETIYKIWCDGTYRVYMQHILTEIVQESAGSTSQ